MRPLCPRPVSFVLERVQRKGRLIPKSTLHLACAEVAVDSDGGGVDVDAPFLASITQSLSMMASLTAESGLGGEVEEDVVVLVAVVGVCAVAISLVRLALPGVRTARVAVRKVESMATILKISSKRFRMN